MGSKVKIDISLSQKEKSEREKILIDWLEAYSNIEKFYGSEEELDSYLSEKGKIDLGGEKAIDDYKKRSFIKSRDNLFTLNLAMEDKALPIKPEPIIQKISISFPDEKTPLNFESCQSALEVLLSSMDLEDRENIYSTFHPSNIKGKNKLSELVTLDTIKKEFIEEHSEQLTNPYSQLKTYEDILDTEIGNQWKAKSPVQYYQLLSLLLDVKCRFGINIKTLFKRLEDDPSFDFIPELYIEPHKINSTLGEVENFLIYQKDLRSEKQDKNVNFYPAVLKEIQTYLLDTIIDLRVKALIKIIPKFFDKLVFLQSLPIPPEKQRNLWDKLKKIGIILNKERDLFVQLAYKIQLKLITNKYRSISKMWDLIKVHGINSYSKEAHKSISKGVRKIQRNYQAQENAISLVGKKVYEQPNKIVFQVSGLLSIIKAHRNDHVYKSAFGDQVEPNLITDITLIYKLIAHEELIFKKKINIFSEFQPAVSSGKKTIPTNKLGVLEKTIRIAMSRNEPITSHLYRTHYHYWVLLYEYFSVISSSNRTIKEKEAEYNEYIVNAWSALTNDADNSVQNLLFN